MKNTNPSTMDIPSPKKHQKKGISTAKVILLFKHHPDHEQYSYQRNPDETNNQNQTPRIGKPKKQGIMIINTL